MSFLNNVDITNFYTNFLSIDRQDVEFIIHEYQSNKEVIKIMALDQRMELELIYLEALFNVGSYGVFLRAVDESIEEIIDKNIIFINGENAFESLLFMKASALFHSGFLEESKKVCIELLKINPDVTLYKAMLNKIYYQRNESYLQSIKWLCILLVLISASLYAINLIFIRFIIGEYEPILFDIAFVLINIGVVVYILGEILSFTGAAMTSHAIIKKIKQRKNSKKNRSSFHN